MISRAKRTCNCASLAQVRKAGEGDSLRSWMLKCLIHSAQSSLVLRWEASPAVRNRPSLTCMQGFKPPIETKKNWKQERKKTKEMEELKLQNLDYSKP